MAIRGILFDKDGTIIDYGRTWLPINREVALYASRGNCTVSRQLLRMGGHDPDTDAITPGSALAAGDVRDIAEAFAAHPQVAPADQLVAGIKRIFRTGGAKHSALVSGVRDTLTELKNRGFRLGVATNDTAGGLEASLAPHGVLDLFSFAVGCDSGFGTKPDPRVVHGFCEAASLRVAEIAMVGDAPHDMATGRAAGVALNVGVLSGTSRREDLGGLADLIVDSINDLPGRPEFTGPSDKPAPDR